MKFLVEKSDLLGAIQTVESVVNERATLPILSNILLQVQKSTLQLTSTDLDIGISCELPVRGVEDGGIAIPARKFSEIVKELPDGTVTLQAKKNNTLLIECGQCLFRLMGLPAEEFPRLPEIHLDQAIHLPQRQLKEMVLRTAFAMSHEETRYVLNGSLLSLHDTKITLVATDGRRLALAEGTLAQKTPHTKKIIIPAKTVRQLHHLLQDEGDAALVFLGENQVAFQMERVTLISRLIDGEFPNYEKVIPGESKRKVRLARALFVEAARRASLFTAPNSQAVRLDVAKNRMTIFKESPEFGEVKEELEVFYDAESLSIAFNPAYLLDALKVVKSEDVELELSGVDKPGVIRQDGFLYMVLPMQVG